MSNLSTVTGFFRRLCVPTRTVSTSNNAVRGSVFNMPKKSSASFDCKHGPENTFMLSSPLGNLELVCCPKGVHRLNLPIVDCDKNFSPEPNQQVGLLDQLYQDNGYIYNSALLSVKWLQCYFHNKSALDEMLKPPVCHLRREIDQSKTATFTDKVWYTLAEKVALGSKVSYGQLAVLSGSTAKSSRAVGHAMRTNPVMIIVPCHRVILSSGQMGNYSGGTKNTVKAWLLRHEGVMD